ncbi:MAG TPA: cyclic dehypoxanthinyl futalosine synthase [Blastocatellia bacterium]|nr:cyclic dehypoxanthinyl futalosine synthase [Blastocatellia bacterium]
MTTAATATSTNDLLERIARREHLAHDEWKRVITDAVTEDLRRLADELRHELHPDDVVTYVVDRNINYSNVCFSVCNFCAFYRKPGHEEGYVLSYEEMYEKVEEMIEVGGSGVLMQGGLHPDLPLEWYTNLLSELKQRYGIHLHCFSPTEVYGMAKTFRMSNTDVIKALMDAGLDSIPGGGGEILVDEIRKKRRTECNSQEWLDAMEAAHQLGLKTTGTMMIGYGETIDQRIEHLEKLYQLQQRSLAAGKPGFVSFIPWTFQPDNTPIGKIIPDRLSAEEYLRWLALSRLYLNNIPNVQVSWLTVGLAEGRKGLHFGANDIGSTMIEENVISKAGANHKATEDMLVNVIREEGFTPVKRKADYVRLSN